jgi:hypothetical protein
MRGDQPVQVTTADVEGLRIAPVPNGTVRGRLRMDSGQKIDWSAFHVSLYSDRPRPPMGSYRDSGNSFEAFRWDDTPASTDVESNGSFEMKAVPADTYRLSIWSPKAFDSYFVKAVNLAGKDVSDSGFSVTGAAYSLDVVIGANGATVEGFVADDKDRAAPDVQVVMAPTADRSQRRDLYDRRTTDARGHFRLTGLNPGEFLLFAVDEDPEQVDVLDPQFIHTLESLGKPIDLKEGEHKSVELKLVSPSD